jgi:hypothetical protein
MAGFLASLESSPSPKQMEFCGNFPSKWKFLGILFGGLLARIAEYLLNGSPREVKFHNTKMSTTLKSSNGLKNAECEKGQLSN